MTRNSDTSSKKEFRQAALFVSPSIGIMALLMGFPLISIFVYCTQKNPIARPHPPFIGLGNFTAVFQDPVFWHSLVNTFVLTTLSVFAHIVVALFLAVQINKPINKFCKTFFRVTLILPWIFTAVVVAMSWMLVLSPLGILNYFLKSLGIISDWTDWLGDPKFAMPWLIIVNIWRGFPYLMVSFLAGLQTIPTEIIEASRVDGANNRTIFFKMTLPLLKPLIMSLGLLDTIWTFTLFPLVWLLTSGGPGRATEVIATYTYRYAFVNFDFGKASASAVVMLLFLSITGIQYLKVLKTRID